MPACSASGLMVARCWRARISVGAMIAACPPASTARQSQKRDEVLPEPTSPCSMRNMRSGCAISSRISRIERSWAPVRSKGKDREDRFLLRSIARQDRPALFFMRLRTRPSASCPASKFVIGQSSPGDAFRRNIESITRLWIRCERICHGTAIAAFSSGWHQPFRQFRQRVEGVPHRLGHDLQRDARSQRIDRFDQRQIINVFGATI